MNIDIKDCVWTHAFISRGEKSGSGMAGLYDGYMFNFLRNYQINFPK